MPTAHATLDNALSSSPIYQTRGSDVRQLPQSLQSQRDEYLVLALLLEMAQLRTRIMEVDFYAFELARGICIYDRGF